MKADIRAPFWITVPLLEEDRFGLGHVGKVEPSMLVAVFLVQSKLLDSEFEIVYFPIVVTLDVVLRMEMSNK